MQMPSQQRWLVVARIEETLHSPALVVAGCPVRLGEIATGTAERQVAHYRPPAPRARREVLDMEGDPRGRL